MGMQLAISPLHYRWSSIPSELGERSLRSLGVTSSVSFLRLGQDGASSVLYPHVAIGSRMRARISRGSLRETRRGRVESVAKWPANRTSSVVALPVARPWKIG